MLAIQGFTDSLFVYVFDLCNQKDITASDYLYTSIIVLPSSGSNPAAFMWANNTAEASLTGGPDS